MSGIDTRTKLLIHFDNSIEDASGHVPSSSFTTSDPFTYTTGKFGQTFASGCGVRINDNANLWQIGTEDFTVDYWGYIDSDSSSIDVAFTTVDRTTSVSDYVLNLSPTFLRLNGVIKFDTSDYVSDLAYGFHHFAFVRHGTTLSYYIDGTLKFSTTDSTDIGTYSWVSIGFEPYAYKYVGNNIDEFRLSHGARWTSNFTPPTSPYSRDSSSEVLLQLHRDNNGNIVDFSNEYTSITTSGTVQSVTGKFQNDGIYINGGYLAVNGSDIVIPENTPFTVSLWIDISALYFSQWNTYGIIMGSQRILQGESAGYESILHGRTGAWEGNNYNLQIWKRGTDSVVQSLQGLSDYVSTSAWHHVAFIRDSSNMCKFYIDGHEVSYYTNGSPISGTFRFSNGGTIVGSTMQDSSLTQYGYLKFDDLVVVSGEALWTSDFAPPTNYLFTESPIKKLYKDSTNKVYGFSNGTFGLVISDWTSLTDAQKEQAFIDYGDGTPSSANYASILSSFKVLAYKEDNEGITGSLTAVPSPQTVVPETLLNISAYERLDSAALTYTQSGNGAIKIAITKDLVDYYVYSGGAWIQIDIADIATVGMTPTQFNTILDSAWHEFTTGERHIAFAYYLSQQSMADVARLDTLVIQGDGNGTWESAIESVDFTYKYIGNNTLRVKLVTSGDYKINYSN